MRQNDDMRESYREGAVGALMDEYERAAWELRRLVEPMAEADVVRVVDPRTQDEDCRSVQSVMSHVVNAAYGYADLLRKFFSIPSTRPPKALLSHKESLEQLDAVLVYTDKTLEGRWKMTDEEISGAAIDTGWGVRYDVEQAGKAGRDLDMILKLSESIRRSGRPKERQD